MFIFLRKQRRFQSIGFHQCSCKSLVVVQEKEEREIRKTKKGKEG